MKNKVVIGAILFVVCLLVVWFSVKPIQPQKKELKIGVSLYLENDTFVDSIVSAMQEEAARYETETNCQVTLNISRANGSQREQTKQIERYIALGYDAICVNLVDRTDASQLIDMTQAEGIGLVFFNREPVKEDILRAENVYYVGSDARETARKQGEAVVEAYTKYGAQMDKNGDGILQYVMLEGEMGHQDTILRSEYVLQTIEESGIALEKLDAASADWLRSRAETITESWIESVNTPIELVLCNNDDMALGAADALEQSGQKAAIFGIDATPAGQAAVQEGRLYATVDCNAAAQGAAIFEIAQALAHDVPISEDVVLTEQRYVRVPVSVQKSPQLVK